MARSGAIPAPPPIRIISRSVSRAWNSPNGPETVTSSPAFNPKMKDDTLPGGVSGGAVTGGRAIRTTSWMTSSSTGALARE